MADRHDRPSRQRLSRRSRSSVVLGALAVAVVIAVLPALADTPETGADPTVTLTVTPSDALSDGQVVTVTGTGFAPNTAGTIRQCGGSVAAPECDLTVSAAFVTTATGDIPPTNVAVERIIDTGTTTFNCGVQACALVATAGAQTSRHHIMMAGAGTSVPSTTVGPTTTTMVPTTTMATTTTTVVSPGVPLTMDATALSNGTAVRVTGTITCEAGMRYRLQLTVSQGGARASDVITGDCTGGEQTFRANLRSPTGPGFEDGAATVNSTAQIGNPQTREIEDVSSTSEEVELDVRGGFAGHMVSAFSTMGGAGS